MKKFLLSTAVILSSLAYAGGDYVPTPTPTESTQGATTITSQFYGGVGLAALRTYCNNADQSWFSEKPGQDKTGALVGIIGYQFTPNVAVEGRAALGVISPDFSESTTLSLFVKPSYNITPEVSIYALLGFGWVKIDGHNGQADIAKKTSPQFGLGGSYKIYENVDLFADYTWLLNDKKTKSLLPDNSTKVSHEAITVGVNYHF